MSLHGEVIEKHVPHVHSQDLREPRCKRPSECVAPGFCEACADDWPCDAYRLAVMVRDVEALALGENTVEWILRAGTASMIAASEVLAIIRPGKTTAGE